MVITPRATSTSIRSSRTRMKSLSCSFMILSMIGEVMVAPRPCPDLFVPVNVGDRAIIQQSWSEADTHFRQCGNEADIRICR